MGLPYRLLEFISSGGATMVTQPSSNESHESTLAACPRCGGPVYDPGIWVVHGGDYCGKDCAAQASGHL